MSDSGVPKPRINKWWIIGGGLAAATVFYIYKKRSSGAAATSATNASATDGSIDPATGIPYADESGDYSGAGGIATGSPWGALSGLTYNAQTGAYELPATGASGTVPTDNASYAKQVTSYLESLGYDPQAVAQALGIWLSGSGQTLTAAQSGIVQVAQGYYGAPPVGVPAPNYSNNGGQSTSVPAFVTGDAQQDAAIGQSSYVAGAYKNYQTALGTGNGQTAAAAQKAYLDAFSQYVAQTGLGQTTNPVKL